MKALLAGALVLAAAQTAAAQPYPVQPGQCVGRVVLPTTYVNRTVRVLEAPGGVQRHVVPPVVEHSWRKVLVHPGYLDRIRLPAEYRIETTSYDAPGRTRWERTPARYALQTERVLVSPGHWTWEHRFGRMASGPLQPGQTVVEPTGEIVCKVWCPARFDYVQRKVLVSPAHAYPVPTHVRRFVQRRVMVHPAVIAVRNVPAVYREVAQSRVVRGARVEIVRIPARYGMVEDRHAVGGGQGWAPVVCGGPLSRPAMQRMQSSLAQQGYDPGPPDGQERPQTYSALRRYQMDRRMPAGQITVESARALGVVQ